MAISGGYDYRFVSEPPDYLKCLICLSVVREAQQHEFCGKLFCKSCISRCLQLESGIYNSCPNCRQQLYDGYNKLSYTAQKTYLFNDKRSEQEVNSLKLYCAKCSQIVELGNLDDHIQKSCENALVPCPNKCFCGDKSVMLIRKNIESHLRKKCPERLVNCSYCRAAVRSKNKSSHEAKECPKRRHRCPHCFEYGTYIERTTTHLETCPKLFVPCSKCNRLVHRCDLANHPLTCSHEPVQCVHHNIGCKEWPLRKDLSAHEGNTKLHLSVATGHIQQLKKELHVGLETSTFVVENFTKLICDSSKSFTSPETYTSRKGYKFRFVVSINPDNPNFLSAFIWLMKGEHDAQRKWPYQGTFLIKLLNQLEDENHHRKAFQYSADSEASQRCRAEYSSQMCGLENFISVSSLSFNAASNCQYLKNDKLVFRVSVVEPSYQQWLEKTI